MSSSTICMYIFGWFFYFYFIKVNHPVSVQKEATGIVIWILELFNLIYLTHNVNLSKLLMLIRLSQWSVILIVPPTRSNNKNICFTFTFHYLTAYLVYFLKTGHFNE